MWRDGRLSLLTPGTGTTPEDKLGHVGNANIAGISPDGRDIFFIAHDRLVPTDVDGQIDLYDARIGGGLSADHPPSPAVCGGDECKGPSSSSPPASQVGTGALNPTNSSQSRCVDNDRAVRGAAKAFKKAKTRKQKAGAGRKLKKAKSKLAKCRKARL